MRPDSIRLEHDAEITPLSGNVDALRRVVEDIASDGDPAGLGRLEAGDRHQRRRLAAATRPEQREELAFLDLEGDVVQCAVLGELFDERFDLNLRHRDLPSRGP